LDRQADAKLQRLRKIEDNISLLRTAVAILPLWILGEILVRLSPANLWGYGTAVLALTAVLLILSIVRVVMTSRFSGLNIGSSTMHERLQHTSTAGVQLGLLSCVLHPNFSSSRSSTSCCSPSAGRSCWHFFLAATAM
jgi:hypothetical protein